MASLTKSLEKEVPNKREFKKEILIRGVDRVIERKNLEKALSGDRKLRVKLGIDPTAPDLHLGHAVVLRKLRDFQNLGHKAVLIIGDFTGMIGDPSGRSKERVLLTEKDIQKNMSGYLKEAGKIIDVKKAEIRHNSEWLGKDVKDILELAKAGTVQQVMQREDFRERIDKGLTILETLYPLLQGYDSVKVRADVELGGTDQLLNLLMGRQVQRHFGMKEQDILTVPLIEGTDGVKKMSKSEDNYIALDDKPADMFGKVMSINDNLILKYFALCTDVSPEELIEIEKSLKRHRTGARDAKARLAYEIVKLYHGEEEASNAEAEFNKVFSQKKLPTRIPVKNIKNKSVSLDELIVLVESAKSKSEARRLVLQGAVRVDYARATDPKEKIKISDKGVLLQVGKRRFVRVKN